MGNIIVPIGLMISAVGMALMVVGFQMQIDNKVTNKTGMSMEVRTLTFKEPFTVVDKDGNVLDNEISFLTFIKETENTK
jgi:hypothetical protein